MTKLSSNLLTIFSGISAGLLFVFLTQSPSLTQPTSVSSNFSSSTMTEITIFQALILGLVQGLTEFLPISSTAHLKVVPVLLGWGDPGVTFTAVIQLGSIAAVLWYFWTDLQNVFLGSIKAWQKSDSQSLEFKVGFGIIAGTLPIVFFGLILKLFVPDLDHSPLRSMTTIAIASILMALLLAMAEMFCSHKRKFNNLTVKDGILMGLAESLALIPGVSRSGSTITAGLFLNLERATAARFSFLLGIPAITLAGLVEMKDVFHQGLTLNSLLPITVGLISAAVFSYLAIAWLIRYLQKQNTWVFVWYRLIFGITILSAVSFGKL